MNSLRIVTLRLFRSYATKAPPAISGIRGRIRLAKVEESNIDVDEIDEDDLSQYESDFMDVGESYKSHERELRTAKTKLKKRIVARKVFKEVEPSFLTFVEKDQIRKLHESDPEEWTPERLSESFPALPHIIRRVLRSNWKGSRVERVLKYDSQVVKNWKDFRSNKLAVDSALREHLMKFKDRKIVMTDRHLLAELIVPPKMELPKPKSKMFSSLVQGYINTKESSMPHKKLITSKDDTTPKRISNVDQRGLSLVQDKNTKTSVAKIDHCTKIKNTKRKYLTFNEFVKDKLEKLYQTSPEEGIVLLTAYRKHLEAMNSEDTGSDSPENSVRSNDNTLAVEKANNNALSSTENESNTSERVTTHYNQKEPLTCNEFMEDQLEESHETMTLEDAGSDSSDNSVINENYHLPVEKTSDNALITAENKTGKSESLTKLDPKSSALDTYVKDWNKKMETDFNYAYPIKIPRKLFKQGMMYRVKDCYYDDDGEFMYRVPGLRN